MVSFGTRADVVLKFFFGGGQFPFSQGKLPVSVRIFGGKELKHALRASGGQIFWVHTKSGVLKIFLLIFQSTMVCLQDKEHDKGKLILYMVGRSCQYLFHLFKQLSFWREGGAKHNLSCVWGTMPR